MASASVPGGPSHNNKLQNPIQSTTNAVGGMTAAEVAAAEKEAAAAALANSKRNEIKEIRNYK